MCAAFALLPACVDTAREGAGVLVDEAAARGLDFTATYGADGAMLFHEAVGPGAAFFDFDRDGDLDVFLVRGAADPGDRLFRNDRGGDASSWRFVDVTASVGLDILVAGPGLGMGATVGDFDANGSPDLYLSKLGRNELWRNEDGFFVEMAGRLGVQDERWSTGASFADLNDDGLLDLFVVNYVDYRVADNRTCRSYAGELDYCGPESYEPEADSIFRNLGGAGFEDASLAMGVAATPGAALASLATDMTGDGRVDVYVANDGMRNRLWDASGGERLEDRALESGVAVNRFGEPEASMGVVFADLDRDGDEDLFLTHLATETNTFYRNHGGGRFDEPTAAWGLAGASVGFTGFGVVALDFSGSGWLDLFIANGAVRLTMGDEGSSVAERLGESNLLFLGDGTAFVDVSDEVPSLARRQVSRGVAGGDVDNDGKPDALVVNVDAPTELMVNQSADVDWAGFSLVESTGAAAIGSAVTSPRGGLLRVRRDGSFMSAQDPRMIFRGASLRGDWRIDWGGGAVQRFTELPLGHYYRVPRRNAE